MSADRSDDDVRARVALSRLAEPGDARIGTWLDAHGAVGLLDRLRSRASSLPRAERYLARLDGVEVERRVDADLAVAHDVGARLVVPGTDGWPRQLDDLGARRPLLLWTRGPADLRLSALCSVAVVGARAATGYGEQVARDLGAGLGERSWTVVSGGAYGVDAAAHSGALLVDGVTVAVLATGVDQTYPRSNDALLSRVLDSGLLVSELHPGARPWRSRFLERNRVIAALTRGTVVVEAAMRSGATATAMRAVDLNRVVMGVPGPVTSAMSSGVHRLLREGAATLVTSTSDVLELVAPVGEVTGQAADDALDAEPPRPTDGLAGDLALVHEALAVRRPRDVAELSRAAGIVAGQVLAALGELALRGLAERVEGGWRAVRTGRDGPKR